jgi:ribosomal protein S12 methylthiotransferase accessory factor
MRPDQAGRSAFGNALRALRPEVGIARSTEVSFDDDMRLWTARVDVGLGEYREDSTLAGVGACGFARGDTMLRAAGEAVERFALIPPATDDHLVPGVPSGDTRRVLLGTSAIGRCSSGSDLAIADCIPASDAGQADKQDVLLPCSAVNDPIDPSDSGIFEPTPSGAASGGSWQDAVLAAFLESVERDAVQAAWALRPHLSRLDHAIAIRILPESGRDGRKLAEVVSEQGLEVAFVLIPTDVMNLCAVIGLLLDRTSHGMVGAGCAISVNPLTAVVRAGREALQVLAALRSLWAHKIFTDSGPGSDYDSVADDVSRARFWSSPHSIPLAEQCMRTFTSVDSLPLFRPEPDLARVCDLLDALRERALRPLACDLTYRLPEAAQAMGWHVAKAVVLGHQVLRMSERHSFTWCDGRLESLARWWNCRCELNSLPHPFI